MNYHRILTVLLAFAIAPIVIAQTAETKQAGGNPEQTLMKIEQEMLDALLKGDPAAAKKYLADTFVFTAPDGDTQNKAQFIADLTSGDLKFEASTNSEMKVQSYDNAAVVTYRSKDKGTYKGRDISGEYRWSDFFVNKDGRWQLVAGHGSALAKK